MILGYDGKNHQSGHLICPSATCRQKLGVFALKNEKYVGEGESGEIGTLKDVGGLKCSCEAVVSPGFLIFKSKVRTEI